MSVSVCVCVCDIPRTCSAEKRIERKRIEKREKQTNAVSSFVHSDPDRYPDRATLGGREGGWNHYYFIYFSLYSFDCVPASHEGELSTTFSAINVSRLLFRYRYPLSAIRYPLSVGTRIALRLLLVRSAPTTGGSRWRTD